VKKTLYQLGISPSESDGEGEDHDEWFTSLAAARKRRATLIDEDPELRGHRYGEDFEITKVTTLDLPVGKMILEILNRGWWKEHSEIVVPVYHPKQDRHPEQEY
jgi:hypothetical protein